MRIILLPVMGLALMAANEPQARPSDSFVVGPDLRDFRHDMGAPERLPVISPDSLNCRSQVITAGADNVPLAPRRDDADAQNPLLYYAMDHRVADCSYLVTTDGRRMLPPSPAPDARVDPAQ